MAMVFLQILCIVRTELTKASKTDPYWHRVKLGRPCALNINFCPCIPAKDVELRTHNSAPSLPRLTAPPFYSPRIVRFMCLAARSSGTTSTLTAVYAAPAPRSQNNTPHSSSDLQPPGRHNGDMHAGEFVSWMPPMASLCLHRWRRVGGLRRPKVLQFGFSTKRMRAYPIASVALNRAHVSSLSSRYHSSNDNFFRAPTPTALSTCGVSTVQFALH